MWKIPLWSKLVPLPRFQQLPYVAEPFFQLGNVGFVEMARAVDAAANLVDVGGDFVHGSGQFLLFGVIDFDDVPVDEHLAGIRAEVAGAELIHLHINLTAPRVLGFCIYEAALR